MINGRFRRITYVKGRSFTSLTITKMKNKEISQEPVNIGYSAVAFIGVLFTVLVVLFIGAVLVFQ
jgi:hypothetical protein